MQLGQHNCGILCLVARRRLRLLVAGIVLLIHYYQPKVAEWEEEAGAGAKDYGGGVCGCLCRFGCRCWCGVSLSGSIILQNLVDSGLLRCGLL